MEMTKRELGVINYAIQMDKDGKAAQYQSLPELTTALSVFDKIKACAKKNDEGVEDLADGKVNFTTEEKAFILGKLDRGWTLIDGQDVLSIKKKLE